MSLDRVVLWTGSFLAGVSAMLLATHAPADADERLTYVIFAVGAVATAVGVVGFARDLWRRIRAVEPRKIVPVEPEYLAGLHHDLLSVQAQRLVEPYIGKWMRVAGSIRDIDDARQFLIVSRETPRNGASVHMIFRPKWGSSLNVLRRGDPFQVEGKISRVDAAGVTLRDCELADVHSVRREGALPASPSATAAPVVQSPSSRSRARRDLAPDSASDPSLPKIGNAVRDYLASALSGPRSTAAVPRPEGDRSVGLASPMVGGLRHEMASVGREITCTCGLQFSSAPDFNEHKRREDSATEGRVASAVARIDLCTEMAQARFVYAASWHRNGDWRPLKAERLRLEGLHPMEKPENMLAGTDEWEAYLATERVLRHDTTTPREDERSR